MQPEIIQKPVDVLIPYARNTRTHSDVQIAQIAASIREFGFLNPVITDGDNGIIAGHGRVMAARKLGMAQVPTIDASHLTEPQKRAFIIADNKIALNAGWDNNLLAIEIADLKGFDFDLDILGFGEDDLAQFLSQETGTAGLTDPDQVPDTPVDPICKTGDIWRMGWHRLMCGSSTDSASVSQLLAGQMPNTMITDPPYGIRYDAGARAQAKGVSKTDREKNGTLLNDDIADWYDAWILFPGSVAYVWHASTFTDVVMSSLRRAGFEVKQQIIWNKNVHALSRSDYHWKHEPCWYAVKPGKDRNWKGGRTQMTVWDIKSVIFENDKTAHPTQKPVEIYTRSLEHHTNPGEYVYEPFGGSGTSIIACEKLDRRSLTMELDPKYCDVIINRWQNFTGQSAVLENDGRSFAEISAARIN